MFVRWRKRPIKSSLGYLHCKHTGRSGRKALSAFLVRSERREGTVRQVIVAVIGTAIRSCCLRDPLVRARFWKHALEDLDRGGIEGLDRVRAALQLARRVVPPSEREWAQYSRLEQGQVAAISHPPPPAGPPEADRKDGVLVAQ